MESLKTGMAKIRQNFQSTTRVPADFKLGRSKANQICTCRRGIELALDEPMFVFVLGTSLAGTKEALDCFDFVVYCDTPRKKHP